MSDWLDALPDEPAPHDVVPGTGPTRESLLRMNDNVGKPVTGTIPGKVITDVNGIPTAVEPSRTEQTIFGGATVTDREVAAAGLTPADVPNLRVINIQEIEGETA